MRITFRIRPDRSKRWKGTWVVLSKDYGILIRFSTLTAAVDWVEQHVTKRNLGKIASLTFKISDAEKMIKAYPELKS